MNVGCDEAVLVERKRFGFSPEVFVWRGNRFEVRRVERWWTHSRRHAGQQLKRRYYRVHCDAGIFELYQDLVANSWHLARAPRSGRVPARGHSWWVRPALDLMITGRRMP